MSKKTKASKKKKSPAEVSKPRIPVVISKPRKKIKPKLDKPIPKLYESMWFQCYNCIYSLKGDDDPDELSLVIRTTEQGGETLLECKTCKLIIKNLENAWEKQHLAWTIAGVKKIKEQVSKKQEELKKKSIDSMTNKEIESYLTKRMSMIHHLPRNNVHLKKKTGY